MSYALIRRTYLVGLVAAGAGTLVAYFAITSSTAYPMYALYLMLAFTGVVAVIGGIVAALYAFTEALKQLAPLEDASWLRLVLVLGVYTLTFVGMLVYLVWHPETSQAHGQAARG